MTAQSVPEELLEIRQKIDEIDADLIELLAARFTLTQQVGELKASKELASVDASREAKKLEELRKLCLQYQIDADLVSELFTRIMAEVVKNHEIIRAQQSK